MAQSDPPVDKKEAGKRPSPVPPSEVAAKSGGRDLAKLPGRSVKGIDEKLIEQWMGQVSQGGESAARMQPDAITPELMYDEDLLEAFAADQGMETIDLNQVAFSPELIETIPVDVARKYGIVPVKFDAHEIWLALSDPHDVQALDDLERILGKRIHGMVAALDDIERVLRKYYEIEDYKMLYEDMAESDDPGLQRKWDELDLSEQGEVEQPAVVKFVDLIFRSAVHERASDIHIEPAKNGLTIRFRIDGVLQEVPSPPRKWQNAIISRLKVLSGMDLAEKRIPLDGRIRLTMPDKKLDLRVSTLPTIFGESVVMRILDQSQVMMGLEDVGFLPHSIKIFTELIKSPNGVILMTGPTGSGKTTTLYAALGVLNTPEEKLVTLEDPVEYQIPGINQIQINQDIGLDFALGLRALLRQDPDVIMVGEIRDMETAENAIRAALTGHLVFSTLHTNDAPSSTVRLIDMGIKPYLVASSLQAAIAQRLIRRNCNSCKVAYRPPDEAIDEVGLDPADYAEAEFFHGAGCERCGQSGYRGRTAIHEIMVMDSELRRRVIRSEPATRLKKVAVAKGMRSLRLDGWEKVLLGVTTLEEVMRITQGD